MAYSLSVTAMAHLDVRESTDSTTSPLSATGGNQKVYDQCSLDAALNSSSIPPVGGQAIDLSFTLTGTTKDYDLTAAPWAGDVTKLVDKTGAKLVGIILRFAVGNNAAGVTFGPQGANGYALFGAAKTPIFYPGDQVLLFSNDPAGSALTLARPAVAAGAKDLRFAGTIGDVWKALLIFNA